MAEDSATMPEDSHSPVEGLERAGVPATLVEYLHACPICFHGRLDHYCRVPSAFISGEFIHYERCADCGTVMRNPRLPTEYRLAQYEERELTASQKLLDPKSQIHYAYMMRFIARRFPPSASRRLLDFGCGAGGFLVAARDAGFDVVGLELSRPTARHVEEAYDIRVFQRPITDPEFAQERFDVVLSSQVFEHLVDPRGMLLDLRPTLVPGGLLLIEVPNLSDTRERLRRGSTMNDSHLFYFSAKSLSRLLDSCGFRVLNVQEGLRPYRQSPELARRAPDWLLGGSQQLLSFCQLKTGLSVLARIDSDWSPRT